MKQSLSIFLKNNTYKHFCLLLLFVCFNIINSFSQQQNTNISGFVKDSKNKSPIELVTIAVLNTNIGTTTSKNGYFELSIPTEKNIIIVFSIVGYKNQEINIYLEKNENEKINIFLDELETILPTVEISEQQRHKEGMQKIDIKQTKFIPSPTGGIEKLVLLTAPGVFSTSELSSTYSVRGGNYDENLVYINDIEVYRPFLIRSGQQEGLSFLNSDLVESVVFSSGGFDASYGDKSASVLDIKYRNPSKFSSNLSMSLLGGSFSIEGISKNKSFTYLIGARYKTNRYVLNAMETKGSYQPNFADIQTHLSYHFNKKTSLSYLGYANRNIYKFVPETRQTSYGTISEAYRITMFFSGQEVDGFSLYKNALTLNHKPNEKTNLKLTVSGFISNEEETFDILGQYWIGKLETDFGNPEFGEVSENRGVGAFLNHTRNFLTAKVINAEHRGVFYFNESTTMQWGIKSQYENIYEKINEWTNIDSAGYSLPRINDSIGYNNPDLQPYQYLEIHETLRSNIDIHSLRHSGFIMLNKDYDLDSNIIIINIGARLNYWNLNNQLVFSPRLSISYIPKKHKFIKYRFASGFYNQPPFYKEIRNIDGTINKNIKAQQSIHFVGGTDIDIKVWNRPFLFTGEIYYKKMNNLIPYILDNVRIRYLPNIKSKGYASGIDFKINGEFVPGIESWVNFSIMQTKENIIDDFFINYYNDEGELIIPGYTFNNIAVDSIITHPGYIPRPTDQRINFSLFFQDYLPSDPTFKMHLGIFFGSGLPFGPPNAEKHKHTLRMPSYKRVDIGISKQIISEGGKNRINAIKNLWFSIEVFNLLQINNTISYLWVSDITGRQYAVPNYLTPRQLNAKIIVQF